MCYLLYSYSMYVLVIMEKQSVARTNDRRYHKTTKPQRYRTEIWTSSQEAAKCNNLRCKSNVGGEVEPICTVDEKQFDKKTRLVGRGVYISAMLRVTHPARQDERLDEGRRLQISSEDRISYVADDALCCFSVDDIG